MLDMILERLIIYSECAVPSIIFYLVTRGYTIKHDSSGLPDWVLIAIGFLELLVPILQNGKGNVLDRVITAVMAIVMTSGMFFYVSDRQRTPEGKPLRPFYDILRRWNEVKVDDDTKDSPEFSIKKIRQDALKFLVRAIGYGLVYIPFFATMDGFIRVCQEPPEIFTYTSYLQQLLKAHIPFKSLFYYLWVGIAFSLHIALIPLIHLLLHAIQLNILVWIPKINIKTLSKLHQDLVHFVAQPPLFNKPWMTRSVYDLWSRRWHQIFRPGFHQVAYRPVRRLFGEKHKTIGRITGTIAVFVCSGLMHDYIMFVMLGYSNYNAPGALGQQGLFFLLQGVATIVSATGPRLPTWFSCLLTWIWVLYTAPLFVEPFLRVELHNHAEVPGFPKFMDSRISAICPYGTKS
ncbi:membrane bound O-acyl transferase family-domain-containing protein [Pilaira anomala]|nr:membrane bound O-acyl transferase family-domain-containing protein [Pilaira anomala]